MNIQKNYTTHPHDMVHIPAKFRENTAMRFRVTVRKQNVIIVQCIYGCKWVNPPQIATELISSPFVPDICPPHNI